MNIAARRGKRLDIYPTISPAKSFFVRANESGGHACDVEMSGIEEIERSFMLK
jgi:hypothetical protein